LIGTRSAETTQSDRSAPPQGNIVGVLVRKVLDEYR